MENSVPCKRVDQRVACLVGVMVLVAGLVETWFTQVLFADGSYFLVRISDSRWFVLDSGRQIGNVLTQLPTVVGIRLFGIHSYHVLSILLGAGFCVQPMLGF